MSNRSLGRAKVIKDDEQYTFLKDIEKELSHYKSYFADKIVFCNCDDPFESNFFKYFAINFNHLGLKKLICTCFVNSPVSHSELSVPALFRGREKLPYKVEITSVPDMNQDGAVDLSDIELLLKSDDNNMSVLGGDGDFRSDEAIELLKEADIVVTNPPFSLFGEYIAQLIKYEKQFLIIGNMNALHYRDIFPLIVNNKMWLGYNQVKEFMRPDGSVKKFGNVLWYTNIDIAKRHEELIMYKHYSESEYPVFDNFKVINVGRVCNIPCDYYGYMGVPDSFLSVYNPAQFEIVDAINRYTVLDYFHVNDDVRRRHSHCCNINGLPTYSRIVIKRRTHED